jgi:hypothetical protein
VLDTPRGWSNRRNTILANTLNHRQGTLAPINNDISSVNMGSYLPSGAAYRKSLDALVLTVRALEGRPVDVYVGDEKLVVRLRHDLDPLVPGAHVTLVYLPPTAPRA